MRLSILDMPKLPQVHVRLQTVISHIGGGGGNGEMANLTNEKGKFAIAIFRHLGQSYLAKFFRLRELQSGKGLSVQICSLGSQESLCKISTNFQLKKMCYSDFKFEVMWAPLKFYYRTFFWS